jgi:hypothetical protein
MPKEKEVKKQLPKANFEFMKSVKPIQNLKMSSKIKNILKQKTNNTS